MNVLIGTFNQEKALVGAFSVIVNIDCKTDGLYAALAQAQARITDRCSAPPPDTVFPDTSLTRLWWPGDGHWPGHQDHTLHVSTCGDMSSCQHSGSFDLHIGRYMVLLLSKDFPT